MESSEREIASFIIETAKKSDTVLGSQLGAALRDQFPGLDLKNKFGGLMNFIRGHCDGELVWIEKRGGDDVLAHRSKAEGAHMQTMASAWLAFTNPNVHQRVAVKAESGQVRAFTHDEELKGWISVSPLTTEDYKEMARGFLPEVDAGERAAFEAAISETNFWHSWSSLISRSRQTDLFKKWMSYRGARIDALFQERLKKQGFSEHATHLATRALLASKKIPVPAPTPYRQRSVDVSLRSMIHRAVDRLSESDLRQLWLPVGVVLDSIDRSAE